MANAQRVVVRKAIEFGYRFRIIARLSVAIVTKYEQAWKTLLELGQELDNVNGDLKEYVKYNIELQEALTYKYMGMQNGVESHMGKAITCMELASEKILPVIEKSKSEIVTQVAQIELEETRMKLKS
jgi:hypothetical protein